MTVLWYKPICDYILDKVARWYGNYSKGDVYASRSYMNLRGQIEDRPTIFAHQIPFSIKEMEHLVRILKAVNPDNDSTDIIVKASEGLKKGKLVPPNSYVVTLALFPNQVKEIYDTLLAVKSGNYQKIEDLVADQKEKAPFEI